MVVLFSAGDREEQGQSCARYFPIRSPKTYSSAMKLLWRIIIVGVFCAKYLLRMRKLFIDVMRITCARGCTEVSGNALVSRGGELVCVL
jgi:hypothetical protein